MINLELHRRIEEAKRRANGHWMSLLERLSVDHKVLGKRNQLRALLVHGQLPGGPNVERVGYQHLCETARLRRGFSFRRPRRSTQERFKLAG
jgi:hypothetical protein